MPAPKLSAGNISRIRGAVQNSGISETATGVRPALAWTDEARSC
jgi:hypothetical protein